MNINMESLDEIERATITNKTYGAIGYENKREGSLRQTIGGE